MMYPLLSKPYECNPLPLCHHIGLILSANKDLFVTLSADKGGKSKMWSRAHQGSNQGSCGNLRMGRPTGILLVTSPPSTAARVVFVLKSSHHHCTKCFLYSTIALYPKTGIQKPLTNGKSIICKVIFPMLYLDKQIERNLKIVWLFIQPLFLEH